MFSVKLCGLFQGNKHPLLIISLGTFECSSCRSQNTLQTSGKGCLKVLEKFSRMLSAIHRQKEKIPLKKNHSKYFSIILTSRDVPWNKISCEKIYSGRLHFYSLNKPDTERSKWSSLIPGERKAAWNTSKVKQREDAQSTYLEGQANASDHGKLRWTLSNAVLCFVT